MKKLWALGVALAATLALGAVVVATASGVEFLLAEWQVGGVNVAAELAVKVTGEFDLVDNKVPFIGEASVLCSAVFIGTITTNGSDLVNEFLDLTELIMAGNGLGTTALSCTNIANCVEPLVWALNLPWLTTAELMEDMGSLFVELFTEGGAGNPGWEVECMGMGGISDECNASLFIGEASNIVGMAVEVTFSRAFNELSGIGLATCSQGGAGSGIIAGSLRVTSAEGVVSVTST